tara:strand:- start:163 stop:816 length:654 start_codon:yes stop_codon:yes gene_type:complete
MKYLMLFFLLLSTFGYGEKVSLSCTAFDYEVESQLNKPLKVGQVRYVSQTLSGFLNSDDYSLTVTTECKGKGEKAICLNLTDSHYCPKPVENFKFRQLKKDGSLVMLSDRCDGSWTKYQMIGEQADKLGTRAYMEYQTYFQLKNQIHSGISITRDKPVFLITAEEGGNYEAKLVSFQRDLWMVNAYDPLRNKLKVSLESYENNPHESFSLSSLCTAN